jgi:hypothetical protein
MFASGHRRSGPLLGATSGRVWAVCYVASRRVGRTVRSRATSERSDRPELDDGTESGGGQDQEEEDRHLLIP